MSAVSSVERCVMYRNDEAGASLAGYASGIAIAIALPFILFLTAGDSSITELPGEMSDLIWDFIRGIRG